MAVTRLKRKTRTNRTKYNNRSAKMKFLNSKPVLKNVDVEKIKEEFEKAGKASAKTKETAKATPKVEEPVAEQPVEAKKKAAPKAKAKTVKAETKAKPKAEVAKKKPAAKKPAAKKATSKKED